MTVFVLDSTAVLRFMDRETGWERVAAILTAKMEQKTEVAIPAVQWGEIAGAVEKRLGAEGRDRALGLLARFHPTIVAADGVRAARAAAIKLERRIPYAHAFALNAAMDSPEHVLVTADYAFKRVDDLARIEFLPVH